MSAPIIPWLGGKRRLADRLIPLFPPHECYVELFCGGAALYFLRPVPAPCEILNDVNGDLINLYGRVNRRAAHGRHQGRMSMEQAPKVEGTSSGTSVLSAGLAPTTLCWNCNTAYPTDARQCPGCCATNANKDLASAQEEMQDKSLIDHDWKWVSDWYGDPEVVNGTADCSHWKCTRCDSEDCEDEPPGPYDDY